MQTFLPYPDFQISAETLDNKRLGKQRVETWQILQALRGLTKGWVNHPATKMWEGCEQSLIQYGMIVSQEWRNRGFQDIMFDRFSAEWQNGKNLAEPWWLGFEEVHTSHQSNLYAKDPVYYRQFETTPHNLPYVWCRSDGSFYSVTQ